MIPLCDVFLPGMDEAEFLLGAQGREGFGRAFLDRGASVVTLKLGVEGSKGFYEDAIVNEPAHTIERMVDSVGAGDAFAAGFLSVWLQQSTLDARTKLQNSLRRANVMGALATQFAGDWESLPHRAELESIEAGTTIVTR